VQLRGKSLLVVVPHYAFGDEEFEETRKAIEGAGGAVRVASTTKDPVTGMKGLRVKPDMIIDEANAADYVAVVFVGGTGASQFWHDAKAHELARATVAQGKIAGATSYAAPTLAYAGLMKGRTVTSVLQVAEKLRGKGAKYAGTPVERDGNIITGRDAASARQFAEALVEALRSLEVEEPRAPLREAASA